MRWTLKVGWIPTLALVIAVAAGLYLVTNQAGYRPGSQNNHANEHPRLVVASEHEEWQDTLVEGVRVEIRRPKADGKTQEIGNIETLGPLATNSLTKLLRVNADTAERCRRQADTVLEKLADPNLDVLMAIKNHREWIRLEFGIARAEAVSRILHAGKYYTHHGTFPTHLFEEPEFTWTAMHGRYLLQKGGEATGVFVPIRISDHADLKNLYDEHRRLRDDEAREWCRVFNGKSHAERRELYVADRKAWAKLRELFRKRPQTKEIRRERRRARTALLPPTVKVDENRMIAMPRDLR